MCGSKAKIDHPPTKDQFTKVYKLTNIVSFAYRVQQEIVEKCSLRILS